MDDQPVALGVRAADNADMQIVRVKHQIAGLGVAPRDVLTVAVLRGCAAAVAGVIRAVCGVKKYPIHKSVASPPGCAAFPYGPSACRSAFG